MLSEKKTFKNHSYENLQKKNKNRYFTKITIFLLDKIILYNNVKFDEANLHFQIFTYITIGNI